MLWMKKADIILLFALFFAIPVFSQEAKDTIAKELPQTKELLVFPFIVKSLETNWGFGGVAATFFKPKMFDSLVRTSDLNLLGLYTLRSQLILVLGSTVYFPHENEIFRFQSSYTYYPDDFWGLGNTTSADAEEGFKQKQFFVNAQMLFRVQNKLYVGANYEFQYTGSITYTPNDVFDKENIAGRHGGNTSGIGPILTWDSRNAAYSPDKGFFSEIQFLVFNKAIGSDFNLKFLSIDLRKYIKVAQNSVLAFQGISGLGFGDVPFRKLEELGGSDMMRGFYGGRFTDKCLMAYQAEFRQFLFWRLGVVAFAATGEVAPKVSDFYLTGLHSTYGGGLRVALSKREKLNLRIDYGIGNHSNAFILQLREAF